MLQIDEYMEEVGEQIGRVLALQRVRSRLGAAPDSSSLIRHNANGSAHPNNLVSRPGWESARWVSWPMDIEGIPQFEIVDDPDLYDEPVPRQISALSVPSVELMLKIVPKGGTIFDIGSGAGQFSLAASAAGFRVLSVEPSADRVALLRASAGRNGFYRMRVIWAAPGSRQQPGEAPRVSVDALAAEGSYGDVGLVRIAADDSIQEILFGMEHLLAKPRGPSIILEGVATDANLSAVKSWLGSLGYEIHAITTGGRAPRSGKVGSVPDRGRVRLAARPPLGLGREWSVEP